MRIFTAVQILNVTSGILCSNMYDIQSYMFGESLFTHQLPVAQKICKAKLITIYPEFVLLRKRVAEVPKDNFLENIKPLLNDFIVRHGNNFAVPTLADEETNIDLDSLLK